MSDGPDWEGFGRALMDRWPLPPNSDELTEIAVRFRVISRRDYKGTTGYRFNYQFDLDA